MKTVAIVQARTGSVRLPDKVMFNIEGKPILQHILDFLKHCKLVDQIVVATTTLTEDDKIEKLVKNMGINCFRGSPDNVLQRYYECAKKFNADLIVRITADNPLIDPELVDTVIKICKETNCDYSSNMIHQSYPLGYLVEALTFSTLKKIYEKQKDSMSKEHVTYHIRQNPDMYNVKEVCTPSKMERPFWRLTVDHIEDFNLISKIFSLLYVSGSYIKYSSVVQLLDNNKDLLQINEKHSNK